MALYLNVFANVAVFNCKRSASVATIAAQFEAQKAEMSWAHITTSHSLGLPVRD